MRQVIQNYMKAMVYLQGIPFNSGNSIKIGDKYVIGFRSDASSYTDVLSAYVVTYTSNKHLGDVADLIKEYAFIKNGFDNSLEDLPVSLLEWVGSDGKTATERSAINVEVA